MQEILDMLSRMTPDHRAELFSHMQERYCLSCGLDIGANDFCPECSGLDEDEELED